MCDGGAEAVRVHEVALDKRRSEPPLADVVADEIAGRAYGQAVRCRHEKRLAL